MLIDQKKVSNLYLISTIIEDNHMAISNSWMKVSSVKAVFETRKISAKKFQIGYAVPIIKYFVAVIRGEKASGDCPVMNKLVNYLLTKAITPREIFDICMGFRMVLIDFLLKEEFILKHPSVYIHRISSLFDSNLSGVLDIFTNIYTSSQQKIQNAKEQKDKLKQAVKIMNLIQMKLMVFQNNHIVLANKPFLDMLGVKDLKELYKKYGNSLNFFSDIDLYEND